MSQLTSYYSVVVTFKWILKKNRYDKQAIYKTVTVPVLMYTNKIINRFKKWLLNTAFTVYDKAVYVLWFFFHYLNILLLLYPLHSISFPTIVYKWHNTLYSEVIICNFRSLTIIMICECIKHVDKGVKYYSN